MSESPPPDEARDEVVGQELLDHLDSPDDLDADNVPPEWSTLDRLEDT